MKLKSVSIITALCMVIGAAVFFVNESGAQGKTYNIGDSGPAGGWVFYDKGNSDGGWQYLEAAPEDLDAAEWGCIGKSNTGAKETVTGTGKKNTKAIIKRCGEVNIAAKLTAAYRGGGKSDWFLPSKDELNLIYINLHKKNVGGLADGAYWSSSEDNAHNAWFQNFGFGNQQGYYKNRKLKVRAVRAFK